MIVRKSTLAQLDAELTLAGAVEVHAAKKAHLWTVRVRIALGPEVSVTRDDFVSALNKALGQAQEAKNETVLAKRVEATRKIPA